MGVITRCNRGSVIVMSRLANRLVFLSITFMKRLIHLSKLIFNHRHFRRFATLAVVLFLTTGWVVERLMRVSHVSLELTGKRYEVSDAFFGVAIDAAMLTDGEWWENSNSPPRPLDFNQHDLLKWTTLLAPNWLRLGGTEADKLWLLEDGEAAPKAPVLKRTMFNDFIKFTDAVGAKPFITASTGPLTRRAKQWQPEQLTQLINWLPASFNGALEFGNEPGAHWLMFGRSHQIRFDQLAREYERAQTQTRAHGIALAGPANAFWPDIGEPLKQVVGSSKDFLKAGAKPDIFTWHYYPTQSNRCGVKTEPVSWESLHDIETLDEFEKHSSQVAQWLADYSPNSIQWLGETGPAQCGGMASLTDRFGASLWWLSHLGIAARTGNQTIIRQSLMGGDYALLDYRDGYSPNPDYWASLLWQQNMGAVGYQLQHTNNAVRVIAHCHKTDPNVLSVVLVNLSHHSVDVSLPANTQGQFLNVTSLALNSRYVFVEDRLAETLDWQQPHALPWRPISEWHQLEGYSYRWAHIKTPSLCTGA